MWHVHYARPSRIEVEFAIYCLIASYSAWKGVDGRHPMCRSNFAQHIADGVDNGADADYRKYQANLGGH